MGIFQVFLPFVRTIRVTGIVSGWLPIGKATRSGKLVTTIEEMDSRYGRINFYISPKRLYEETGFLWKGERQ